MASESSQNSNDSHIEEYYKGSSQTAATSITDTPVGSDYNEDDDTRSHNSDQLSDQAYHTQV